MHKPDDGSGVSDQEYMERHGLRDGDRVVNEFEFGVDDGPPVFIRTYVVRASGEEASWPLIL